MGGPWRVPRPHDPTGLRQGRSYAEILRMAQTSQITLGQIFFCGEVTCSHFLEEWRTRMGKRRAPPFWQKTRTSQASSPFHLACRFSYHSAVCDLLGRAAPTSKTLRARLTPPALHPCPVQYKVLREGPGLDHPKVDTQCDCHYAGRLLDGSQVGTCPQLCSCEACPVGPAALVLIQAT